MALTPTQVRAKVDSELATLWTSVQNRQAAYFAATGRYFQCLWSHSVPPADGADVAPDLLASRPYYQAETIAQLFPSFPASIAFALSVDQYDGPQGKGYVGTAQVTIAGQTWRKAAQVGPETWRAQAWAPVPP